MKNLEKVEAYFNNELNDSEKNDFLREVEADTELKREYDFQKEVIDGIKEARKAELKAMLNKVPISATSTATSGIYKIIAGGAATILLGTAAWYFVNSEENIEPALESKVAISEPVLEENNPTIEGQKNIQAIEAKSPIKETDKDTREQKEQAPKIITPVLPTSEDNIENQVMDEENLDIPDAIGNTSINISSKINVEIKLKKKYDFHYQYSNKGIILYGDFEEGLFEILELNKEDGTELYLYYESNYYYIKDKSGEITPLKLVSEKNLKKNLEGLR